MRSFIGKTVEAITLNSHSASSCGAGTPAREASATEPANQSEKSSSFTEALTDNYLKLRLRGHHAPNQWLRVQVENVIDGVLIGQSASPFPDLRPSRVREFMA